MKFIHVSDLHLGKNMCGYSLIDQGDQKFWVEQFLKTVDEEKPDAIVIAGDVYDRSVAPQEAIKVFNEFMVKLYERKISVLIIAGNHDSGIRLASLSGILSENKIHIAGEVTKEIQKVVLNDEFGAVNFYLLPYIFPAAVEQALGIKGIKDYDEALRSLLKEQNINFSERNVIVSHQAVCANGIDPERGGSEEMIGGSGNIDVSAYDGFDYVALGHIHAAQKVKYEHVRYSGSPLCYHFDELKKPNKGPIVVTMNEKGKPLDIRTVQIKPLHSLREIDGTFAEIMENEKVVTTKNEYVKVVFRDEVLEFGAASKLETALKFKESVLMEIFHRPARDAGNDFSIGNDVREKSIEDAFSDFYNEKKKEMPNEREQQIIKKICEQLSRPNDDGKTISDADVDELIDFVMELEGLHEAK